MSLLLAPYNNAMRLGQGFNSYTQQICVDDAVVVDPDRAENIITNDGTTMRIIAQSSAKPSAWTRQKEVVNDRRAEKALVKRDALEIDSEEEEEEEEEEVDEKDEKIEKQRKDRKKMGDEEIEDQAEDDDEEDTLNEKDDGNQEEAIQIAGKDEQSSVINGDKTDGENSDAGLMKIEHSDVNDDSRKEDAIVDSPEDDPSNMTIEDTKEGLRDPVPKSVVRNRSSSISGKASKSITPQTTTKTEAKLIVKAPAVNKKIKGALVMTKMSKAAKLRKEQEAAALKKESELKDALEKEENERITEQRAYQKTLEKEERDEARKRRSEDRAEESKIREEKRQYEAQRREENREAIKKAAEAKAEALTLKDLDRIKAQNQFVERFSGMEENDRTYEFDPTAPRGPSQTVIYTSRFVDKLSDVTDDMSVSGSLSIKAAKVGGSGRGSFVDSDKFKESDLNFYISVKVINQTLNFKDALVYNPIRSVDENNFQQVYGDSFISGFLEGGEFNALVSMKILNKAKMTDIKAEAKVAFTAGPIDVTAEANVGIARSNIETNTETTIQVSWCGGGHIKPMDQQWDIKSLMQAAARFPDLVADCPQRTYAILTKYESLRSFVAMKPASYTKLQYENAQIYTNALLDSFMEYKSLYKRLGEQIFNIQGKTLEFVEGSATDKTADKDNTTVKKDEKEGLYPYENENFRFEPKLSSLSEARKAIRRQMMRIVNEVDLIEKDPKLATDEDHQEPFESPVVFESRLPAVQVPAKLRPKSEPLTGKRIMAKTQTEEEQKNELEAIEEAEKAPALYTSTDDLTMDEKSALDKLRENNLGIGNNLRVTSAVGTTDKGTPFTNLDFLQPDWEVQSIRVEIARGAVTAVEILYDNGLILKKGKSVGGLVKEITSFLPGERITYASLEYGELPNQGGTRVLAIRLFTNHGRRLLGQAATNVVGNGSTVTKDGVVYENVKSIYVDSPFQKGTFRGFFGRCEDSEYQGIIRIGLIWGNQYKEKKTVSIDDTSASSFDYTSQSDSAEIQALREDLAKKNQALQDALAGKKPYTRPQSGFVSQSSKWDQNKTDQTDYNPVKFSTPYPSIPRLISGLTTLDEPPQRPIRISARHENITPNGFDAVTRVFGSAISFGSKLSWLALPDNDVRFETGVFASWKMLRSDNNQVVRSRPYFSRPFQRIPTVVAWLYEVNMDNGWHSMRTDVGLVNEEFFDLSASTWANRTFTDTRVAWLAFDDNACNNRVKVGYINVTRAERWKTGTVEFDGIAFTKTPSVFMALMLLDAGNDFALRLSGEAKSVTTSGFTYECGTWSRPDDYNMHMSQWVWIAVE